MPDLSELFTLNGAIAFTAGVVSTRLYYYVVDRKHNRDCKDGDKVETRWKTTTMAWVLIAIAIAYSFSETHRAYVLTKQNQSDMAQNARDTRELAQNVKDCQREFNEAIMVSRSLNKQADDITAKWQDYTFERTAALNNRPPDLANVSTVDPRYLAYKSVIDNRYYQQVAELQKERERVEAARQANPLPEPTCGK